MNKSQIDANMKDIDTVFDIWNSILEICQPVVGGVLLMSGHNATKLLSSWPAIHLNVKPACNKRRAFVDVYAIFPPNTGKEPFISNLTSWKLSAEIIKLANRHLIAFNASYLMFESILDKVNTMKSGSCIIIPNIERYVWQKQDEPPPPHKVLIGAAGNYLRSINHDQLINIRVYKMLKELLIIAKEKELFIITSCDHVVSGCPQELNDNPDWAHFELTLEENKNLYRKVEEVAKKEGIECACKFIFEQDISEEFKNKLIFHSYYTSGRFESALCVLENNPSISGKQAHATNCMQLAYLINDTKRLNAYCQQVKATPPEDYDHLKICVKIAEITQDKELLNTAITQLSLLYPETQILHEALFNKAIYTEKYKEAQKHAESLNDGVKQIYCSIVSSDESTWLEKLRICDNGIKEELAILLAKHACSNQKIYIAKQILDNTSITDAHDGDECEILICIHANDYFNQNNNDRKHLVTKLVEYISNNRQNIKMRCMWENLLNNVFDKKTTLALMIEFAYNKTIVIPHEFDDTPLNVSPTSCTQDEIESVFTEIKAIVNQSTAAHHPRVIFDKHELPVADMAAYERIATGISSMLYGAPIECVNDIAFVQMLLDILSTACRHTTTNNDVIHGYNAVKEMAQAGLFQQSRNFSETLLLFLPAHDDEDDNYRLILLWNAYADSFRIGKNNISAIIYIAYAVSIMSKINKPKRDLWVHLLRDVTLIFRDNCLYDFALRLIKIEKRVNKNTKRISELRHVELSCIVPMLIQKKKYSKLRKMISYIDSLLNDEKEKGPLLSLKVTILLALKDDFESQHAISSEIAKLQDSLKVLNNHQQAYFSNFLEENPSYIQLLNAIKQLPDCIALKDLIHASNDIKPLARNAAVVAFANNDVRFFVACAEICSNPFINNKINININESSSQKTLHALLTSHSIDKEIDFSRLEDDTPLHNISFVLDLSCEKILKHLSQEDEMVCLAWGDNDTLLSCCISHDGVTFNKLDGTMWHKAILHWNKRREHLHDTDLTEFVFNKEELMNLSFPNAVSKNIVRRYILPPIDLFGFPFQLLTHKGKSTIISVIPSAQWLINNLAFDHSNAGRFAWLGSINSPDEALEDLRSSIADLLIDHNFDFCDDSKPILCKNIGMAVVACHGDFISTMALSDGLNSFRAHEFSKYFNDTHLVVLFACNAGSGEYDIFWKDIESMAEKLLAQKVSCVIAPLFPLQLGTVEKWLTQFLFYIKEGRKIDDSASMATKTLRYQNDYILAWSNLHVYGNGNFILAI